MWFTYFVIKIKMNKFVKILEIFIYFILFNVRIIKIISFLGFNSYRDARIGVGNEGGKKVFKLILGFFFN